MTLTVLSPTSPAQTAAARLPSLAATAEAAVVEDRRSVAAARAASAVHLEPRLAIPAGFVEAEGEGSQWRIERKRHQRRRRRSRLDKDLPLETGRLTPRCGGQYPGVRPGIAAELIRRYTRST